LGGVQSGRPTRMGDWCGGQGANEVSRGGKTSFSGEARLRQQKKKKKVLGRNEGDKYVSKEGKGGPPAGKKLAVCTKSGGNEKKKSWGGGRLITGGGNWSWGKGKGISWNRGSEKTAEKSGKSPPSPFCRGPDGAKCLQEVLWGKEGQRTRKKEALYWIKKALKCLLSGRSGKGKKATTELGTFRFWGKGKNSPTLGGEKKGKKRNQKKFPPIEGGGIHAWGKTQSQERPGGNKTRGGGHKEGCHPWSKFNGKGRGRTIFPFGYGGSR